MMSNMKAACAYRDKYPAFPGTSLAFTISWICDSTFLITYAHFWKRIAVLATLKFCSAYRTLQLVHVRRHFVDQLFEENFLDMDRSEYISWCIFYADYEFDVFSLKTIEF